jgi:hypothetical protein
MDAASIELHAFLHLWYDWLIIELNQGLIREPAGLDLCPYIDDVYNNENNGRSSADAENVALLDDGFRCRLDG